MSDPQTTTAADMAVAIMNAFAPDGKSDGWWYAVLPKLTDYLEKQIQIIKTQTLQELELQEKGKIARRPNNAEI